MTTLTFDAEEMALLQEAMERFTRTVGGDLAREKRPSVLTKNRMTRTLELSEKIRTGMDPRDEMDRMLSGKES